MALQSVNSPESAPRVAFLINFLAPDLLAVCREWQKLNPQLRILASVAMEGNRSWQPEHEGLDVVIQKTWTIGRTEQHPSGYADKNYIHLPRDTFAQLKKYQPSVVVSAELGFRSALAAWFCSRNRKTKFVVAVCTTEHLEQSRNALWRRWMRQRILKTAHAVTYNGPSCRKFLSSMKVAEDKLHPWDYIADPRKIYRGELKPTRSDAKHLRLLTIGQLIERKGVLLAARQLVEWSQNQPHVELDWTLLGSGPDEHLIRELKRPANLRFHFHGNASSEQIANAYAEHECLLFPTLGDEWGLVVDEAMHSGLTVIGSRYAQSCQTLIEERVHGYCYDPLEPQELGTKLSSWHQLTSDQKMAMRQAARKAVHHRQPQLAAQQMANLIHRLVLR